MREKTFITKERLNHENAVSASLSLSLSLCVVLTIQSRATEALTEKESPMSALADYSVTSRDANSRTWERTDYETRPDGKRIPRVHRVVELASGLYYTNSAGQWLESKEEIEIVPGGAVARQGQHKVIFADNLNTAPAIDMETPDGKRLQSSVLGLCYFDSSSGESVVIAEVKDCEGEVSGNRVLYRDAFDGLKADVRYTYTRAGFEQDIILREQPPSPAVFGLNPATTTLQVLTEFYDPPQPIKRAVRVPEGDVFLDFGATRMGRGKAFLIGDEENGVPVNKQWIETGGRSVLIEEAPLQNLRKQLETLPRTAMLERTNTVRTASIERVLPAQRTAKATSAEMKLAKASAPAPGLVLDYTTLTGYEAGDYTLAGGVTYYVSGTFVVGGTLTIEGGTVVKVAESSTGGVIALNDVECETSLYRPAIFTSKNDDSAGETISGSSGSPSTYNCTALIFDVGGTLPSAIENLHIRYAATGLEYCQGQTVPPVLRHCQFVNVGNGILNYSDPLTVENVLFSGVSGNVFTGSWYSTFSAAHLTVHNATALTASGTPLTVANSLFVSAPDGSGTVTKTDCDSPSGSVFTTLGAGSHYLEDENYRFGQPNGSAKLLADFRRMTTYPPTQVTPQTISSAATWNQTVARETGAPLMIGYHYPALDYLASGVNVDNTTLTLGEGVAVATYGGIGLQTSTAGELVTHGNALAHNQLCFYPAVQEQPAKLNGVLPTIIISWYGGYSQPSALDARFTDFSGLAGMPNLADGYVFQCQLRDCRVGPGRFDPESPNTSDSFINNLFERAVLHVGTFDFICPLSFYNNTARYSTVQIDNDWGANGYRTIKDNLFDHSTVTVAYPAYAVHDHNAYYPDQNTTTLPETGHTLSALTYATGPLGNRYIDSSSPTLINAGSRTVYDAGLDYYYTVLADQTRDGSGGNGDPVDVGFHYYALYAPVACTSDQQICPNNPFYLCGEDYNGLPVSYTAVSQPSHGTLGHDVYWNFGYTPDSCYEGEDTFTYEVYDGYLYSAPDTVTVTVADAVHAYYNPSPAQTCKNTPLSLYLGGNDDCGLTVDTPVVLTQPAHGTLSGTSPNVTYTPNDPNFTGTDSFTFQVNNSCGDSDVGAVNVTVGDANLCPNNQTAMTGINQPINLTLTANDNDSCTDDPLTYTITANPSHGAVTPSSGTGAVQYTPSTGYEGVDTFNFTASDGNWPATCQDAQVTIFVVGGPTLTAECRFDQIVLNWSLDAAVQDMELEGLYILDYKIYRSTTHGGPYTLIHTTADSSQTAYVDMNVTSGTTYYYVVTFQYQAPYTSTIYGSPYSDEASASPCSLPSPLRPGFNQNVLAPNDDNEGVGNLLANIGFSINFYGTSYSTLYVNNNGLVSHWQLSS